jgi:hypothetical protein
MRYGDAIGQIVDISTIKAYSWGKTGETKQKSLPSPGSVWVSASYLLLRWKSLAASDANTWVARGFFFS